MSPSYYSVHIPRWHFNPYKLELIKYNEVNLADVRSHFFGLSFALISHVLFHVLPAWVDAECIWMFGLRREGEGEIQ